MSEKKMKILNPKTQMLLTQDSKIVVIGGGPAGSFFAIKMLRRAKDFGKKVEVILIERKKEVLCDPLYQEGCREGCNYCAGGISPRLCDVLEENGLVLPPEIIQGNIASITIQGDWKNIELQVPKGRKILVVYRGSRPLKRSDRYFNFDSFLLNRAIQEGAKLVTGEVYDVQYLSNGKPVVRYRDNKDDLSIEPDFVVFAAGVNQRCGIKPEEGGLFKVLGKLIPEFIPPKVRKALILELEIEEEFMRTLQGELHFIEYGSKDFKIEMSSIVPKGKFLTVVLIGKSVEHANPSENLSLAQKFLEVPHIARLIPKRVKVSVACICTPNMTVGVAKNPYGDRLAVIGDMVTSRLYKDGLLSAYITSSALVDTLLEAGMDRDSLRARYWPVVREFDVDNKFGLLVFMLNRITFSDSLLSRIFYQAAITERKYKDEDKRKLEKILWKIASGEDKYKNIFLSMFHPTTIFSILAGGLLITMRNYLIELLFGLKWENFDRYPTGVSKESSEAKRRELVDNLGITWLESIPEMEKLYTIRIKADRQKILQQLGKFGDEDRAYFKQRMIRVHRIFGNPNEEKSVIRYDTSFPFCSFSVVLEKIVSDRYLVYEIQDGFGKGGILIFDVHEMRPKNCFLSIYVAFNFVRGECMISKAFWGTFRLLFPGFVHDVLWNHAFCKLKDVVEKEE